MPCVWHPLVACLFLATVQAASVPSQNSLYQDAPNSTELLPLLETNQTSLNLPLSAASKVIYCSEDRVPDLQFKSCDNAWIKIPDFRRQRGVDTRFISRKRTPGPLDVTLPIRYLSDDGKCAVDIEIEPGVRNDDIAPGELIGNAAHELLFYCVKNRKRDGTIRWFSSKKQLTITFSNYSDRIHQIACDGNIPSLEYIERSAHALESLATNPKRLPMGLANSKTGKEYVTLPRRVPKDGGPLMVGLITGSEMTKESWWNIWCAGVAVFTMCTQKGRRGTAIGLGDSEEIFIRLGL